MNIRQSRQIWEKCSVNDCEKVSFSRGLCGMHHSRLRRYGDVNISADPNKTTIPCVSCGELFTPSHTQKTCSRACSEEQSRARYRKWFREQKGRNDRMLLAKSGGDRIVILDKPLDERFWSKVNRTTDDACWEWTCTKNSSGYGVFRVTGFSAKHMAHRLHFQKQTTG